MPCRARSAEEIAERVAFLCFGAALHPQDGGTTQDRRLHWLPKSAEPWEGSDDRFLHCGQPCAPRATRAAELRLDAERALAEPPRPAGRSHGGRRARHRSTGSSLSRSMSTRAQHLDEAAWVDRTGRRRRAGSQGMVAALPLERGKAIEPDLERLRAHSDPVRRTAPDPDPAGPGFLHQPDFIAGLKLLGRIDLPSTSASSTITCRT